MSLWLNEREALQYRHVDKRYILQLRIELSLQWVLLIGFASAYAVFASPPWHYLGIALTALLVIAWCFMVLLWAPRRFALTGYLARCEEVNYRTGALWRKHTAVPINRIQHVEITQGMIERVLGLGKLVIYTAGGHGSDLAIAGLAFEQAETLRDQLLTQVKSEHYDSQGDPQA